MGNQIAYRKSWFASVGATAPPKTLDERNPEKIKDEKGEPMWKDISHFNYPDGPAGKTPTYHLVSSHAVMRYSKNIQPYRYTGRGRRMIGYAGPANAKAGEVYSKYVVTDMFAKAVQRMKPEEAVKWAEGELKKVYEA